MDLAAPTGAEVRAVTDGVVTHVGVIDGRGTVSVLHASGIRSTYEPVEAVVREGDVVLRGQDLGKVSTVAGHCEPSSCLHLGAVRGETYLDPMTLLAVPRIILLPPLPR